MANFNVFFKTEHFTMSGQLTKGKKCIYAFRNAPSLNQVLLLPFGSEIMAQRNVFGRASILCNWVGHFYTPQRKCTFGHHLCGFSTSRFDQDSHFPLAVLYQASKKMGWTWSPSFVMIVLTLLLRNRDQTMLSFEVKRLVTIHHKNFRIFSGLFHNPSMTFFAG